MGFHLCKIFAVLTLALAVSHAALPLPPHLYWNSVLPNTPMPVSISQLVQPDFVTTGKVTEKFEFGENQDKAADTNIMYWYGRASPYFLDQVLDIHRRKVFFLEKDIHTGTTMKYRLVRNPNRATFLSRKTADGIPFSSSKLQDILNQFLVKVGSADADMIKEAIRVCEDEGIRGELRHCATSLEAMIDFTTSKLGGNVEAISTEVEKGATSLQNYTIISGVKKLSVAGSNLIACHKMNYPYALFLCHEFENTRAYMVPVKGEDGKKGKAIAIFHVDTHLCGALSIMQCESSKLSLEFRSAIFLKPWTSPGLETRNLHDHS